MTVSITLVNNKKNNQMSASIPAFLRDTIFDGIDKVDADIEFINGKKGIFLTRRE